MKALEKVPRPAANFYLLASLVFGALIVPLLEGLMDARDALLIVDVQNDFCPGGALPIQDGDQIVPVLNDWIREAHAAGTAIVVSRDWHPPNHASFQTEGGPWPCHCVQQTAGARLHPQLNVPDDALLVSKGTHADRESYSAFDDTGLAEELRRRGIGRIWIGGLALDVCVRATVLDACRAGFEVHVILAAVRAVDATAGREALQDMQRAGASLDGCLSDEGA